MSQIVRIRVGAGLGDGDAKANRTCGKINVIDVLCPGRIGLHPAKAAKLLHALEINVADEILHGVKDRRGVRFHRDAVLRPESSEIQCRDKRHH